MSSSAVAGFATGMRIRAGNGDRGVIRPGAFADLVIFDPETIADKATYTDPYKLAAGVTHVLVNGVPVLVDGTFTDALPGRVLKK